ncbi:MAG: glutamate--tRNA ligase, partial [Halanaerobiales bacterium]
YRQSERVEIYREYADKLLAEGKAYYCYCTPEELQEMREEAARKGEMPRYNGHCRNLSPEEEEEYIKAGRKPVIRFKIPGQEQEIVLNDLIRGEIKFSPDVLDDFIIFKSDGMPTYNFAVVIDDALMKISQVIRGEDHISNTPKQILLYKALGFPVPEFAHLPLILDENRAKLKKRSDSDAIYVGEFRQKGYLPEALFNFLSLVGWSSKDEQEIMSREEIISRFDIADVNKSSAVFDVEKLNWMNGKYIREADLDRILELSLPYLQEAGLVGEEISGEEYQWLKKVIDVARRGVDYLSQIPAETELFFKELEYEDKEKAIEEFRDEEVELVFTSLKDKLKALTDFNQDSINDIFKEIRKELGVKPRKIYHPVRLALTGKNSGPELSDIIYIFGLEEVEKRLDEALALAR